MHWRWPQIQHWWWHQYPAGRKKTRPPFPVLLYLVRKLQDEPSIASQTIDLGKSNDGFLRMSLGRGNLRSFVLATAFELREFSHDHSPPSASHGFHLAPLRFKAQSGVRLAIRTNPVVSEPTNRPQPATRRRRHSYCHLFQNYTIIIKQL